MDPATDFSSTTAAPLPGRPSSRLKVRPAPQLNAERVEVAVPGRHDACALPLLAVRGCLSVDPDAAGRSPVERRVIGEGARLDRGNGREAIRELLEDHVAWTWFRILGERQIEVHGQEDWSR